MSVTVSVELSVEQIAAAFAELNDDEQARVIVEVARIAGSWTNTNLDQWYAVGRHLRTCSCSSEDARELVRRIALGLGAVVRLESVGSER